MSAPRRVPVRGSVLFFCVGPLLEAGVGPFVLSSGWSVGSTWPLIVRLLGGALVVAGLVVVLRSFVGLARDGFGTPSPAAPTQRLVVTGAYRWVRHPMYTATGAVIAGQGLLLGQWVLLVAAAVYLLAMAALARFREEPALLARYGEPYATYRATVPAVLPRPPR